MAVDDTFTKVLLHFDREPDTSTFPIDESESNHKWYSGGNAQIKRTIWKIGPDGGSLDLDGTGDYIYTADHTDFSSIGDTFTIDMWVKFDALASSTVYTIYSYYVSGSQVRSLYIDVDGSGNERVVFYDYYSGGYQIQFYTSYGSTFLTGVWYHIAVVYDNQTPYIFIDGVSQSVTDSASGASGSYTGGTPYIGIYDGTNNPFNGNIDEFRYSVGVARWTSGFTPQHYRYGESQPVDDSYTKALLNFTGIHNGTVMYDGSGKLWTAAGNAKLSTLGFRMKYASLILDGTGDYLSTPDHTDFSGIGDTFTIDCWVNFSALANNTTYAIFTYKVSGSQERGLSVSVDGSGNERLAFHDYYSGGYQIQFYTAYGSTFSTDTWYHVAVVYDNQTPYLFIDGVEQSITDSASGASGTYTGGTAYIGTNDASTYPFAGNIDAFRYSVGVARWTSGFTPQHYPYEESTPSDGSEVQLDFIAEDGCAAFYDSGGKIWKRTGSVVIDTDYWRIPALEFRKRFGAAILDGTEKIYPLDNSGLAPGSGDWTIEFWIRWTSLTSPAAAQMLFDYRPISTSGLYISLYKNTSEQIEFITDSATRITSTTTVIASRWYHIALVKSSGTTTMYIDGVAESSTYSDSNTYIGATNRPAVGGSGYHSNTNCVNGHIDQCRISIGTAQYTTDFTPPHHRTVDDDPVDDEYTQFLIHGIGDNATSDIYNSAPRTLVRYGDPQVVTTNPKFGIGSTLHDGGLDSYYYPGNDSALGLGSGDWTVDFWVWFIDRTVHTNTTILVDYRPGIQGAYPTIYKDTSHYMAYYTDSSVRITGTTAVSNNTWYHVAVVRYSGTTKLYVNGTQEGSSYTDSNTYLTGTQRPLIGNGWDGGYALYGYLEEVRISKGIARWTTNFTPPTSEYVPVEVEVDTANFFPFLIGG
jgi:hypothetical protein